MSGVDLGVFNKTNSSAGDRTLRSKGAVFFLMHCKQTTYSYTEMHDGWMDTGFEPETYHDSDRTKRLQPHQQCKTENWVGNWVALSSLTQVDRKYNSY